MTAPSPDSPATPPSPAPRVPFVIGVTGNVDPEGYADDRDTCNSAEQIKQLKTRIKNILIWVTASKMRLDPATGELSPAAEESNSTGQKTDPWLSLGMEHTPILVLSSLAPGADTIVAETVMEYAEDHPHLSLAAPLPFPEDLYEQCSTFDTDRAAKLVRYQAVLKGIRKQSAPGPIFCVALDNDCMPPGRTARETATDDVRAIDPKFGEKRRRLRYRAAGEYIAVHSDLLIAIQDEPFDLRPSKEEEAKTPHERKQDRIANIFEAGTATIIEAKRRGLTHELLAVANNFAWADNGPVLHIPIVRQKRAELSEDDRWKLPQPGPMRFLHPYDLKPADADETDDQNADWQKNGDTRFRRVLARQEEFNRLKEDPKEAKELDSMTDTLADIQAIRFASALDPIARIRLRSANVARKFHAKREKLLISMFWLIFAAATLYGSFEHWHHHLHKAAKSHKGQIFPADPMYWTQFGLLLATLACVACCGIAYHKHRQSGREKNRFDYRAIGEALRVQFFWKLAGTGRSVASDYMQRQRDELDWIRYVVSSISLPHETTRAEFLALPRPSQVALLEVTRKNWVGGQMAYFLGTPGEPGEAEKREHAVHFWHTAGWILAAAGLACMFLMLLAKLFVPLKKLLESSPCQVGQWLLWPGLVLLTYHVCKACFSPHHPSADGGHGGIGNTATGGQHAEIAGFFFWVFGNPFVWGCALVLAGVMTGTSFVLGEFHYWPDGPNWWIIFTGTALLGGALCVAWAEKNFHAEEARQYRAMGQLFSCADRRLEELIARYEMPSTTGPAADRILFEIHDILHQLGCEALDENAEWLIQHRSRPLEMIMAG